MEIGKFEQPGTVSGDGPHQLRQAPGTGVPPPQEPPAERIQTIENSGGTTALCLESSLSSAAATDPSFPHHTGQHVFTDMATGSASALGFLMLVTHQVSVNYVNSLT